MEKIIELYAYFILTILGFVVPVFAVLLSLFSDGLSKLAQQYESERSQTEKNLASQLQKSGESQAINLQEIEQTIQELKKIKQTAEEKLHLLDPKKAIRTLFGFLAAGFLFLFPAFLSPSVISYIWAVFSLFCTAYALIHFWKLFDIIVEVRKVLDIEDRDERRKVPDLLSEIVKNTQNQESEYYLKKVFTSFNNIVLKQDISECSLDVDKKIKAPISITNSEKRMAKDVEAGFRFPANFLIEKSNDYAVYTTEDEQIVRFSSDRIHGNTNLLLEPLVFTPLSKGTYDIKTFIKGENIESTYRTLKITVK